MLSNLTTKKKIRTFSISPENLTGEKGKGGMATEGSASAAARELGQGWKVNPYLVVEGGSTCVLADVKGQGAIKHIWITDSARARILILRIFLTVMRIPPWRRLSLISSPPPTIASTVRSPVSPFVSTPTED